MMTTSFNLSVVQACIAAGRLDEGRLLIDATIRSVETNGDFCYMSELLRMKANLCLHLPRRQDNLVEDYFHQSLTVSRGQGALAWELRTSIDLAKWAAAQGKPERARALLQPVFNRFADGDRTADLRTAKALLAGWA
jgi:predicted ATPase